jgi:glucose repression regulatory protein TUP1
VCISDTPRQLWDIKSKRIARFFDGHSQDIYSLQFSRDGRLIVSGSGDRTARVWDTAGEGSTPGPLTRVLSIEEPDVDAGITCVSISPDGRLVAAGSLDTEVRIWDVQTGQLLEKLLGHRDSVYSVAFTPDSKGLLSSSLDKTLKYWDVRALMRRDGGGGPPRAKDGEKLAVNTQNFLAHKDFVLSVAMSADGQWIVSGSKDRGVCIWDARTAQPQLMIQGHKNSGACAWASLAPLADKLCTVISIDLSPISGILGNGSGVLASGSGDCLARIWSYAPL